MANYTPPAVTRQSLLQDYVDTLNNWQSDYKSNSNASAMSNFNRMGKLRDLISMVYSGDSSSSEFINPFGAGGGSSAPAMSTDNRFSAGLSDAESRLRALLDQVQHDGDVTGARLGADFAQTQFFVNNTVNIGAVGRVW